MGFSSVTKSSWFLICFESPQDLTFTLSYRNWNHYSFLSESHMYYPGENKFEYFWRIKFFNRPSLRLTTIASSIRQSLQGPCHFLKLVWRARTLPFALTMPCISCHVCTSSQPCCLTSCCRIQCVCSTTLRPHPEHTHINKTNYFSAVWLCLWLLIQGFLKCVEC